MSAYFESPKRARGKCPECGFSFLLRKDGSVQTHPLYIGSNFLLWCPPGRRSPFKQEQHVQPTAEEVGRPLPRAEASA